jgi:hypothetical protein
VFIWKADSTLCRKWGSYKDVHNIGESTHSS